MSGKLQAAPPCASGSQTSFVQRLLSLQTTTGVAFGVEAWEPGVFGVLSCVTPPV
jgi:hypothetical protein